MGRINIGESFDSLFLRFIKWSGNNKLKIAVFLTCSLMLIGVSYLPYFNLVFNKALVAFLIIVNFTLSFKLGWKITLYLAFVFLLISYILIALGLVSLAEMVGNYIYGLLILVVVGFFSAI